MGEFKLIAVVLEVLVLLSISGEARRGHPLS